MSWNLVPSKVACRGEAPGQERVTGTAGTPSAARVPRQRPGSKALRQLRLNGRDAIFQARGFFVTELHVTIRLRPGYGAVVPPSQRHFPGYLPAHANLWNKSAAVCPFLVEGTYLSPDGDVSDRLVGFASQQRHRSAELWFLCVWPALQAPGSVGICLSSEKTQNRQYSEMP